MTLDRVFSALCSIAVLSSTFARGQEPLYSVVGKPGDAFARAIANVGDIDLDGSADLLVGACESDEGAAHAGKAMLLSGRTGTLMRTFTGTGADQHIGESVAGAGDITGDGIPDLLVGAPRFEPYTDSSGSGYWGCVLVFSGSDGSFLAQLRAPKAHDSLGMLIRALGDVDQDGFPDILVSADGRFHVFSGHTLQQLYEVPEYGSSMTAIADLNGDGLGDFAIGIPKWGFHGANTGAVSINSGKDGSVLRIFEGTNYGEELGTDIVAVPDQDGDHLDDLFVLAGGDTRDKKFRVISSLTGNTLRRFEVGDDLTLGGFVFGGADLNGDHVDDWLFEHDCFSPGFSDFYSRTYLVSGASGERLQILEDLSDQSGRGWGGAVSVGDLNGDGRAELALHHARVGSAGDAISFLTREGVPGKPTLLVIEAVNGVRTFFPIMPVRYFDATGGVKLSAITPPGYAGLDALYRSYALDATDRIIASSTSEVQFR